MPVPANMKPQHDHDCEACKYLGTVWAQSGPSDWYLCKKSIVCRRSSEGPDYSSLPVSMIKADTICNVAGNAPLVAYNEFYITAGFMLTKAQS